MTVESYTRAREKFATLLNQVEENRDVVLIRRRGHEDVALVAAAELDGLFETAHLLRSPKNAKRLLAALRRAQSRSGKPTDLRALRKKLGLQPTR